MFEIKVFCNTLLKFLIKIDTDNRFPMFGMGSKLPPLYDFPNNFFALNKNIMNPEITDAKNFLTSKFIINQRIFLF